MKLSTFIAGSLLIGAMPAFSQIVSLPMSVNSYGQITETVSGEKFTVSDAHTPINAVGVSDYALRFDGYSTYVEPTLNASSLSDKTLTISLWCAPQTYPMMNANEAENLYSMIFGNLSDDSHSGFAFNLSSQGDYNFECYTSGWKVTIDANEKLKLGEWSHLVATVDASGKKISLYNNGVLVGSGKCLTEINVGGNDFIIGKNANDIYLVNNLLNTFCGLIDDINIYNEILSEDKLTVSTSIERPNFNMPEGYYSDNCLRPTFHGMPSSAWTNETHGMIYHNGKYHAFFQKNANGAYMARLHWGHISSDNLYAWTEEPIAIAPGEAYDIKGCWSGCVINDEEISGGKPAIIYTAVDNAKATICMAIAADDDLINWDKCDNNPLINGRPQGLSDDFRDPYFFRTDDAAYIIVGSSKNGVGTTTLHKYDPSSKTWSNDGTTFFTGTDASSCGTFWEMPNVTKIGDKWLFTVTPLNTKDGVRTIYWTGSIDSNGQFVPNQTSPKPFEAGGVSINGYGLLSPTIMQHDGKTIALGIVPDKISSEINYQLGWAHNYSLPRELTIDNNGNLVQRPFSGLDDMHSDAMFSQTDFTLSDTQDMSSVSGRLLEVAIEFEKTNGDCGFNLLKSGNTACKVYYSGATNQVIVDCSSVTRYQNDSGVYDGIYRASLSEQIANGDKVKLTAYLDGSILDIFINNTQAFSVRVFATDNDANGVEAFATTATKITSLNGWKLNPQNSSGINDISINHNIDITTANGMLTFVNIMNDALVNVYDLMGRKLASRTISPNDNTIALNHGTYIVNILTQNTSTSRKITL